MDAAKSDIQGLAGATSGVTKGLDASRASAKALSAEAKEAGARFAEIGKNVPGIEFLKSFKSNLSDIKGQVLDVAGALKDMASAGDGGPMSVGSLRASASSAEQLYSTLGDIRKQGDAIASFGDKGLNIASGYADKYEAGAAIKTRLRSILVAQGRGADFDTQSDIVKRIAVEGHFSGMGEIREGAVLMDSFSVKTEHMNALLDASARQARTMGISVAGVAEQMSKAYASGNVGALRRSGVVVTDDDISKLNEAYARSAAEGQAMFVDVIGKSIRDNSVSLQDSLTETMAARNDAARSLGAINSALGEGAAQAGEWVDNLKVSLYGIIGQNPELLKTAGFLGSIASQVVSVVGNTLSTGAHIGQLILSYRALGAVKTLEAIATKQGAIASSDKAAADAEATIAATANAEANTALAAAEGEAAIAAGGVGEATVTASGEAQAAIDLEIAKYAELIGIQREAAAGATQVGAATAEGAGAAGVGAAGAGIGAAEGVAGAGALGAGAAVGALPFVGAAYVGYRGYQAESDLATGDYSKLSNKDLKDKYDNSFADNVARSAAKLMLSVTGQSVGATLLDNAAPRLGTALAGIRGQSDPTTRAGLAGGALSAERLAAGNLPPAAIATIAKATVNAADAKTKGQSVSLGGGGGVNIGALFAAYQQSGVMLGNPLKTGGTFSGADGGIDGTNINGNIRTRARLRGEPLQGGRIRLHLDVDDFDIAGLGAQRMRKRT